MANIISVKYLTKSFKFSVKDPERSFFSNFFKPSKKDIIAVDNISFDIPKGESVAFIGPNGAGKSTTIKMLTGILYPTSGEISVAGLNPQKDRRKLSYEISTVFGQRSQLLFNLPVKDSFTLFGAIYDIPTKKMISKLNELAEIFDIKEILDQPVRKLSLGQRMKCEIAVSLIHEPKIVFLDEPTIGLDVVAKKRLRETLLLLNKQGITVFLTSHDVGDIETISTRTIIINQGRIIIDKPTKDISSHYLTYKYLHVELDKNINNPKLQGAKLLKQDGNNIVYLVDTAKVNLNNILKDLLDKYPVLDIDINEIPLEQVISEIYEKHHA